MIATSGGIVTTGTTSGDILAGATGTVSLNVTSYSSCVYTGTAILDLISDGGPIDGLGTVDLGGQTVDVTGTVYNYAIAEIVEVSGAPRLIADGTDYTVTLGQVGLGAYWMAALSTAARLRSGCAGCPPSPGSWREAPRAGWMSR